MGLHYPCWCLGCCWQLQDKRHSSWQHVVWHRLPLLIQRLLIWHCQLQWTSLVHQHSSLKWSALRTYHRCWYCYETMGQLLTVHWWSCKERLRQAELSQPRHRLHWLRMAQLSQLPRLVQPQHYKLVDRQSCQSPRHRESRLRRSLVRHERSQ
jgi:hypothetical protein